MNKAVFVTAVSSSVVVLDQVTKWLVRNELPLHDGVPVLPGFFSIVHAANRGGAFSLFADAHEAIRLPFFVTAAVIAVGFLVYFVRQIPSEQRLLIFALAAVLGGALGNLIDRALFGEVTDFLLVYYRGWFWPAFNVADSFISIGVTILVAHSIFSREADQPHHA
ncbi:MAG: signal peptidase II [Candidatus Binatia bacterium]